MDFRQLRYFLSIVDFGNMTKAAKALHIAQPALSQQVMNLEADLGMRLLDRSVHGVKPTQAGDLLYRHGKSILRQVEDTRALLRAEGESPSGDVSVCLPASAARIIAIALLTRVKQAYPAIRLELVERRSADIARLVEQGHVDMAIAVDVRPHKGLSLEPLLIEALYAIFPRHAAVPEKGMTLAALARHPLVLPARPNTIRQQLDNAFVQAKREYRLVAEISTTSLLAQAAREGLGVTVLPWSAIGEEAKAGELQAVPLIRPGVVRELALCVSDEIQLSAAAQAVRHLLRQLIADLLESGQWQGTRAIAGKKA